MGRHIKTAAVCLVSIALLLGFPGGGTAILCEAKETVSDREVREVTAFVEAYQNAQTPEGIDTLADYVMNAESQEFQRLLVNLQTAFEHGAVGYEEIDVVVLPMSDGTHWIAVVGSEWVIRGFDVTLPGLKVELVGRSEDGGLQIESYSESDVAVDFDEIREITLSDEIIDWNTNIASRYNEICAENSDIVEWLMEVSEEATAREAELTEEGFMALQEPSSRKGRYVVKEGDCLWRIAEEQLGDGMKWSGLYEANKAVIGENPDLLYVGITLQLN